MIQNQNSSNYDINLGRKHVTQNVNCWSKLLINLLWDEMIYSDPSISTLCSEGSILDDHQRPNRCPIRVEITTLQQDH